MNLPFSILSGALFGAGLHVSGMTDTTKVQGWLDIFGAWDPTLAFVMAGAILPMALAWRWSQGRKPVAGERFPDTPSSEIAPRLVLGSILFGMGWGLSGMCPGPAVASLGYSGAGGLVFLATMLVGMGAAPAVVDRLNRKAEPA
ncbi:MAG: DUF6691 family protein [Marinibacterium sp.]